MSGPPAERGVPNPERKMTGVELRTQETFGPMQKKGTEDPKRKKKIYQHESRTRNRNSGHGLVREGS